MCTGLTSVHLDIHFRNNAVQASTEQKCEKKHKSSVHYLRTNHEPFYFTSVSSHSLNTTVTVIVHDYFKVSNST